ncbi:hypothetical protein BGZ63DRAFT_429096 [Mariannaea sp. PMI_226]|nr:hypothetical protein BGZ63DRAFT_429096 [Mariannaea sp. PMI_226]
MSRPVETSTLIHPSEVIGSINRSCQAVQLFVDAIDNNREIKYAVRSMRDDLQCLIPLLKNLITAVKDNACEIALQMETQYFLQNCRRVCEKHAHSIRLTSQDQITTLRAQLTSFKSILNTLLQTSTYLKTARQPFMTKEMMNPMLQQFESVLERQIVEVKQEQSALARYSPPRNDRNREDILQEIRYQRKTYEAFQKLCEEALKQTVHQRTGQKIFNVKAHDKSVALTGFVNAEEEETRIDQEISDVAANVYSIAVAGVVKKIDYVALAAQMRQM